ncbi:hypothetical protein [Pengzhenrongella sp.]|uniref:hypothetical protein n=1 Tax=Pengzhenrongella sp. TaxID=2888820 RepID=UPI002F92BAB9
MSTNVNREHPKGNNPTVQDRAGFVTVAQRIKSHRISGAAPDPEWDAGAEALGTIAERIRSHRLNEANPRWTRGLRTKSQA